MEILYGKQARITRNITKELKIRVQVKPCKIILITGISVQTGSIYIEKIQWEETEEGWFCM